jgi:hypothetical protein
MKERSFEDLWDFALNQGKSRNDVAYHSCCDVWTTRGAEKARSSHLKKIRWKELMAALETNGEEDKKKLMHAKMIEEGWRIPFLLNKPCFSNRATKKSQLPFKIHIPQHRRTFSPMSPDRTNRDLQIDYNNEQLLNRFDLKRLFQPERQQLSTHIFHIAVWFPSSKSLNSRTQQNTQAEDFSKLILELPNNISSTLFKAINELHAEKSLLNERLVKDSLRPLTETLNNSVSTLY